MEKAILDNDIIEVFDNIKKDKNEIFKTFFTDFDKEPQINEFVYEHEALLSKPFINSLLCEGSLNLIKHDSYITNINEALYKQNFKALYFLLNGKTIDDDKIFQKGSKENKGEIHSILCAHYLQIAIFMSNDGHSRMLLNRLKSNRNNLKIYRMFDGCKEIATKEDCMIKKRQLDAIASNFNSEEQRELSQIWNNRKSKGDLSN